MFLTINPFNLYNFRYQIYKACEERSVYLELVIEFPQRKTYKLLGRRTRRFATASSSLSLWKAINVSSTKLNSTRMLIESKHFSSGLSSDSNSPSDDSELHSVFRWTLSKNRNHQSKTDDTPSLGLLEQPFTKFISIMKKVGQPTSANQPSLYCFYLRPPRWPPWSLPPTEPPLLNELAFLYPALMRVLLLML